MNDSKPAKKHRKMQVFDVAFTDKGDLCDCGAKWMQEPGYVGKFKWEKNKVFPDTLVYDTYYPSKGGNSHIAFISAHSGRKYEMFMSDFDEAIQEKLFIDNKLVGLFTFCRKGVSQGIRVFFEAP